jgi:hypothetical protein
MNIESAREKWLYCNYHQSDIPCRDIRNNSEPEDVQGHYFHEAIEFVLTVISLY